MPSKTSTAIRLASGIPTGVITTFGLLLWGGAVYFMYDSGSPINRALGLLFSGMGSIALTQAIDVFKLTSQLRDHHAAIQRIESALSDFDYSNSALDSLPNTVHRYQITLREQDTGEKRWVWVYAPIRQESRSHDQVTGTSFHYRKGTDRQNDRIRYEIALGFRGQRLIIVGRTMTIKEEAPTVQVFPLFGSSYDYNKEVAGFSVVETYFTEAKHALTPCMITAEIVSKTKAGLQVDDDAAKVLTEKWKQCNSGFEVLPGCLPTIGANG